VSGWLAFLLRFEFGITGEYLPHLVTGLAAWTLLKPLVFHLERMDRGWSQLVSSSDVTRIVAVNMKASAFSTVLIMLVAPPGFPRTVYFIDLALCVLGTLGVRMIARLHQERSINGNGGQQCKQTLIYGAGQAGEILIQDIKSNARIPYSVVGFIDDDPAKHRMVIHGVRVLGPGQGMARLVARHRIEQILIAVPSASGPEMTIILQRCHDAGVSCKTVPGLDQILRNSGLAGQVRDVAVEDLLGRHPVELDTRQIRQALRDSVVLVTGAGGSIGSELCRQIARFRPRAIIGYEISENALYELNHEMKEWFPDVEFHPAVGSVQNEERLADVMTEYRPNLLYHAAAYKHVPMMEAHLFEAVENNVFGTSNVVRAAHEFGVDKFVLISSDKAVRPTNVMGATKRVAELIAGSMQNGGPKYVSVRFGNVLGSNGSVIPLFKKQIAAGGPVTVTHPDMQRYFMTISEAVQLVLQASAMGNGGEVFVLDMGQPVRIVDLARNLILLSGLRPETDIRIEFSGVRPGEKLCEELNTIAETTVPTRNEQIRIFTGPGAGFQEMSENLGHLRLLTASRDTQGLIRCLQDMVADYHPSYYVLESAQSRKPPRWDSLRTRGRVSAISA
jgi:FlaA1/EpsC-like NDP-sugar epimerase